MARTRRLLLGWLVERIAEPALAAAVARIGRVRGRVVEIGTRSGASLPHYLAGTEVTGFDTELGPLRVARARRARRGYIHVAGLARVDPEALPAADAAFDAAVVLFRLFEAGDPRAAIGELGRVVKPGGEIVILDFLAHGTGWRAWIERRMGALGQGPGPARRADMAALVGGAALTLTAVGRVPPLGLFTIVCLRAEPRPAAAGAGEDDGERPEAPRRPRRRLSRRAAGSGRGRRRRLTG